MTLRWLGQSQVPFRPAEDSVQHGGRAVAGLPGAHSGRQPLPFRRDVCQAVIQEESRVGHSLAASANSGPPSLPQSHPLLWWQLTPASQLDDQDWHLGPSRPTVASAVPTPLRALS